MSDPNIEQYKTALKQLGLAVKSAHKTKEGKKLPSDYWVDVIKMLKKAKLGISMMELGIDDESEIAITHDKSKETSPNDQDESQPNTDSESDESSDDTESKLASIGLKKESSGCVDFYDTMNHLGILLSEKFDNVSGDGTKFVVGINDRKFTIKFDDKFFMVSEDYNFELGDDSDMQSIVNTFAKLSSISHENLVKEYNQEIV